MLVNIPAPWFAYGYFSSQKNQQKSAKSPHHSVARSQGTSRASSCSTRAHCPPGHGFESTGPQPSWLSQGLSGSPQKTHLEWTPSPPKKKTYLWSYPIRSHISAGSLGDNQDGGSHLTKKYGISSSLNMLVLIWGYTGYTPFSNTAIFQKPRMRFETHVIFTGKIDKIDRHLFG